MKKIIVAFLSLLTTTAFASLLFFSSPGGAGIITSGLVFEKDATIGNGSSFPGSGCGTTTWTDIITSSLNGTISNCSTGWTGTGASTSPYALQFNYLSPTYVSGTNGISLSGDLTIQMWVNFSTFQLGFFPRLMEIADGTNAISLIFNNSVTQFQTKDSTYQSGTTGLSWAATESTSVWYNVAAVFQPGSSTTTFYVNGVSQTSSSTTVLGGGATNAFFMGIRSDLLNITALDGLINEALIYNRALSGTEVTANCNALISRFSGMTCS